MGLQPVQIHAWHPFPVYGDIRVIQLSQKNRYVNYGSYAGLTDLHCDWTIRKYASHRDSFVTQWLREGAGEESVLLWRGIVPTGHDTISMDPTRDVSGR